MFEDLEENAKIFFVIRGDFPRENVEAIARRLATTNCLIPGFIAPEVGLVNLSSLLYADLIDGTDTIVILDRNIASRMSRVAREGARRPFDSTTQIAVDLMALSQAMNIDLEPSLAFHELAHRDGNAVANEELSWFRAADHGQAWAWIDIALGRQDLLPLSKPAPLTDHNLAAPLHRWRCNYAAALKTASLELAGGRDLEKLWALLGWMVGEFIVAGPAAIFAAMYFGPRAPRKGLLKQLNAANREYAIAGIRNAAWDITHLSEMTRRVRKEVYSDKRYLFATADQKLSGIAACLFSEAEDEEEFAAFLEQQLAPWWEGQAPEAAAAIVEAISIAQNRPTPFESRPDVSYVDRPIEELESVVRAHR